MRTPAVGPCPVWCQLPAGHDWDAYEGPDRRLARWHEGPHFGEFVCVGATEYAEDGGHVGGLRVSTAVDQADDFTGTERLVEDLQAAAAWVRRTQDGERWWVIAPNPQCRPWCTRTHERDEFARGAALNCARVVEFTRGVVRLAQITAVDERAGAERGAIEIDDATVEIEFDGGDWSEDLFTLEGAAAIAEGLPVALLEAQQLVTAAQPEVVGG